MWDRPLVSEESFVPCRVGDESCRGQVTSNRYCDTHRPKCTCEGGGHALLCPAHAEEAQELMARMVADDANNALDRITNRND